MILLKFLYEYLRNIIHAYRYYKMTYFWAETARKKLKQLKQLKLKQSNYDKRHKTLSEQARLNEQYEQSHPEQFPGLFQARK